MPLSSYNRIDFEERPVSFAAAPIFIMPPYLDDDVPASIYPNGFKMQGQDMVQRIEFNLKHAASALPVVIDANELAIYVRFRSTKKPLTRLAVFLI